MTGTSKSDVQILKNKDKIMVKYNNKQRNAGLSGVHYSNISNITNLKNLKNIGDQQWLKL